MSVNTAQVAFDAIRQNAIHIPRGPGPFAVGGYINGAVTSFQWTDADYGVFPRSYHIRVNVTGELHRGNCLDVEAGDATPANVQPWIMSVKDSPDPLLVYCNRSNRDAVTAARDAASKAAGAPVWIWCATLDGTLSGNAMTQFTQTRDAHGNAVCDVSLIQDLNLLSAMAARIGKQ